MADLKGGNLGNNWGEKVAKAKQENGNSRKKMRGKKRRKMTFEYWSVKHLYPLKNKQSNRRCSGFRLSLQRAGFLLLFNPFLAWDKQPKVLFAGGPSWSSGRPPQECKEINHCSIPALPFHWMGEVTPWKSSPRHKCHSLHFVSPQTVLVLKTWLCLRGSKWHKDTSIHSPFKGCQGWEAK